MRILYITFGLPSPPDSGARLRDFNLVKRVARHHRVSILSLLEFENELQGAEPLNAFCGHVDGVVLKGGALKSFAAVIHRFLKRQPIATAPYYHPGFARKITELTRRERFDVIQFEHSVLAPYRSALHSSFNGATVLSMHNIGAQQYRSMLDMARGVRRLPAAIKHRLMKGWEADEADRFHQVITVSECDRERLISMGVRTPVSVIENGVDCSLLQPLPPPGSDTEEIIFIGTMGYLPNRDAARYMVQEILPLIRKSRPDCRLNLVGSGGTDHLSDLVDEGVVNVTGRVDDPTTWYARSRLAVVPLRSGGGSRLKILEAMALGRPVVSTTLGREGLSLRDGQDILTADTAEAFADHVVSLLEDDRAMRAYAMAGRKRVESDYDWDLLSRRLLETYESLAKPGPGHG